MLMSQEQFDAWCRKHQRPLRWMVDANEDDLEAARQWIAAFRPHG